MYWASVGNWKGGGTKGFPHVQSSVLNLDIYSHSFTSSFNDTPPPGALYTYMYDMFTQDIKDELMVIEHSTNSGNWGVQVASNQTIAGRFYPSIWQANNGYNNVIIFAGASPRDSGSEDCMAYFKWAYEHGFLANSVLREVSYGVEPTTTVGTQQFTQNSFSASYN